MFSFLKVVLTTNNYLQITLRVGAIIISILEGRKVKMLCNLSPMGCLGSVRQFRLGIKGSNFKWSYMKNLLV